jgi:hypothetical protein
MVLEQAPAGKPEPILVWRGPHLGEPRDSAFRLHSSRLSLSPGEDVCRFCGEELLARVDVAARYLVEAQVCGFCGWSHGEHQFERRTIKDSWQTESLLRALAVNSAELCLDELQRALLVKPELIDHVHHRRFEQFVADAFRVAGYSVELTRSTKDGGRDLIVMRQDDEHEAIVEVKRHRAKVGVGLVRELRGVQLRDGVSHAVLVAARGFTSGALTEAQSVRPKELGFTMTLVDALDFLRSLDLLREPAQTISALDRDRTAYRAWLRASFPPSTQRQERPTGV